MKHNVSCFRSLSSLGDRLDLDDRVRGKLDILAWLGVEREKVMCQEAATLIVCVHFKSGQLHLCRRGRYLNFMYLCSEMNISMNAGAEAFSVCPFPVSTNTNN